MSAFRDRGGVCDYYKYALIRHLTGISGDDAAAQLRFAFLCLYDAFRDEGPRCWDNRSSNPQRIRALDPELAAGFDAIEKDDWSFAKLVEMGLLPASAFLRRSQPPKRGPGLEVSEEACQEYLRRRDAWFAATHAMMPRDAVAPIDLLVIEPYAQIVERLTYPAAKASFDAWHTPFPTGADGTFEPLNDEDFEGCFKLYQRCDSGSIYWDELARLWQDGHSLLVYQQIYELPKFGKEMRAAQARFAEIAPDGVLFDAVKFVPWYSSRSISFLIAVQPCHADTLEPRWKALPEWMGEGASEWDGFTSFQDERRWHHTSALGWTEQKGSGAASD
jgi:hypothetical protein